MAVAIVSSAPTEIGLIRSDQSGLGQPRPRALDLAASASNLAPSSFCGQTSTLIKMSTRWSPPVPLCSASVKDSFAYESTVRRWPIILTTVIDELSKQNASLLGPGTSTTVGTRHHVKADRVVGRAENESKLKESKELINQIGGFIYDMRHDRELPDLNTGNKLS